MLMLADIGGAIMPWEAGAGGDYVGGMQSGILQSIAHAVPAILGVVAIVVCLHVIIALIYRYVAHSPMFGASGGSVGKGGSFGSDDINFDDDDDE